LDARVLGWRGGGEGLPPLLLPVLVEDTTLSVVTLKGRSLAIIIIIIIIMVVDA